MTQLAARGRPLFAAGRPRGARTRDARAHALTTLPEAEVYLTHYLLLRGWKEALPKMGFRTVIFDEMQELRHAGTEKYSAASLVSSAAENVDRRFPARPSTTTAARSGT